MNGEAAGNGIKGGVRLNQKLPPVFFIFLFPETPPRARTKERSQNI